MYWDIAVKEAEACTAQELSANLLDDYEVRACAEFNGVKARVAHNVQHHRATSLGPQE